MGFPNDYASVILFGDPRLLYSLKLEIRRNDKLSAAYRFTTYQDARRVTLVDGLFETNILPVSPVKSAAQ